MSLGIVHSFPGLIEGEKTIQFNYEFKFIMGDSSPRHAALVPIPQANAGHGLRKNHLNPPCSLMLRPHRGQHPLKLQEPQWSLMLQQKEKGGGG